MVKADDDGKRINSKEWTIGAFALTKPSPMITEIICDDDCPNCPLWKKGCAGKCPRWDDLVCSGCPCLASKYAKLKEVVTVNPDTLEEEPIDPKLVLLHEARKDLLDGQKVKLK